MNSDDRRIAEELKRRLSGVVALLDFRVFGSRARGDAGGDSDTVVYIELESVDRDARDGFMDVAWDVGFENEMVISPLVMTRNDLGRSPLGSARIVQGVRGDGVPV